MYGKVHGSFFDSSINDTDPVTRLVFIGMIVLSDQHGKLDVTRESLSRRLNIDRESIDRAITVLSSPDELSRSPDRDGRRIVPIDDRSWGWYVVNKPTYRHTRDEELRQQAAERKRRQRERERESNGLAKEESKTTDTYTGHHAASRSSHALSRFDRDELFGHVWSKVPRKEGRKLARRYFEERVNSAEDAAEIVRGVENYAEQVRLDCTTRRYTLKGSTLLNNIDDYINLDLRELRPAERPEGLQGVAL